MNDQGQAVFFNAVPYEAGLCWTANADDLYIFEEGTRRRAVEVFVRALVAQIPQRGIDGALVPGFVMTCGGSFTQ